MPSGKVTYRQRDILLTRFPFSDLVGSKVRPVLGFVERRFNSISQIYDCHFEPFGSVLRTGSVRNLDAKERFLVAYDFSE